MSRTVRKGWFCNGTNPALFLYKQVLSRYEDEQQWPRAQRKLLLVSYINSLPQGLNIELVVDVYHSHHMPNVSQLYEKA